MKKGFGNLVQAWIDGSAAFRGFAPSRLGSRAGCGRLQAKSGYQFFVLIANPEIGGSAVLFRANRKSRENREAQKWKM